MVKISFPEKYSFDDRSIRYVQGITGLYFIFLENLSIPYPFHTSCLIYIGMSDSRQNSVGNRLRDHKSGQSGNQALKNYAARFVSMFTYLSTEMLKALGSEKAVELESIFLESFAQNHGSYPICNNQAGHALQHSPANQYSSSIDWSFFYPSP